MKGTVYKIIALQGNEIYIGSTFGHLNDRWYRHKQDYRIWLEGKEHYMSSFELFKKYGVDNCRIVPIKEYKVLDRRALEVYETLWICKLKSVNKIMPVALAEFFKREKKKQYREDHKEEIAEYQKQWYEEHKDETIERAKHWYREHKDEKKEYDKQRSLQKVRCDICNIDITKQHIRRHERRQIHINNLNKNSNTEQHNIN